MSVSRRDFLKGVAALSVVVAAPTMSAAVAKAQPLSYTHWAEVFSEELGWQRIFVAGRWRWGENKLCMYARQALTVNSFRAGASRHQRVGELVFHKYDFSPIHMVSGDRIEFTYILKPERFRDRVAAYFKWGIR